MLTKRIIACLDVKDGRVVKGVQFLDLIDAGDPASLAKRHAAGGADEIVLLDITATHEGRGTLLDTVAKTAKELFIPFTVGGGIRSPEDAAAVFDAGADKVSINSAAIADPGLIDAIGRSFGAQAVIVAIDARRAAHGGDPVEDAEVYVHGGRTPAGRRVLEWAREAEDRGAGEILLTSMDADGTREGFDCELTARVSEAVGIPVIASGGAGICGPLCPGIPRRQSTRGACGQHLSLWCRRCARAERGVGARRRSCEVALLIPSIDLMGGRIVQLVRGETLKLAFDDFDYWIGRFRDYPLVQLIDLDAAMRQGDNGPLIREIAGRLPCQVGGGIGTVEKAMAALDAGARRVIVGSALYGGNDTQLVNLDFARALASAAGQERLVFSVDTKQGRVAVKGWKRQVDLTPDDAIRQLEPYCSAFLYTHIDNEGTMQGFPLEVAERLRRITQRQLIVAGGIRAQAEIDSLDAIGVDAVAGMAVYSGILAT